MRKILYTKFKNIDDLISKLSETKEFKKAIKRANLYKFWAKATGEKFAKILNRIRCLEEILWL